jgi:hypothetical protein
MSESTETLKFKIGLSGTFFDKRPEYSVSIDNTEYAKNTVTVDSDEIFYVEFDASFSENESYFLNITLLNKTKDDTKIVDGEIVNDMLLNIVSVEVDEIDLGSLIWTASEYFPKNPQKFNGEIVSSLKNCVNLGWNGTYKLPFTTPFYIWLLENI